MLFYLMTQKKSLSEKNSFALKDEFLVLLFSLLIFSMPLKVYAGGMSELEIIVKEAVILKQPFNPVTGVPLTFDHIGYLNFGYNDRPNKCIALVGGLILETEDYKSNPVMGFSVCVSKNVTGLMKGEVLELYFQ